MTEREDNHYERALEVLKSTADAFNDAGVPPHEIPPAMADHLMYLVLVLGQPNGVGDLAGRTIIKRMRKTLDDWRACRHPFEDNGGPDDSSGDAIAEAFLYAMNEFLLFFFASLDEDFVKQFLRGGTREEAAQAMLGDVVARVRGNRPDEAAFGPMDIGAVMDRLAALHLQVRHGEEAVNVPGLTYDEDPPA
ncbi:MAG: hypothetical protein AAFX79_13585 [Planctomycetota bacterium]